MISYFTSVSSTCGKRHLSHYPNASGRIFHSALLFLLKHLGVTQLVIGNTPAENPHCRTSCLFNSSKLI